MCGLVGIKALGFATPMHVSYKSISEQHLNKHWLCNTNARLYSKCNVMATSTGVKATSIRPVATSIGVIAACVTSTEESPRERRTRLLVEGAASSRGS